MTLWFVVVVVFCSPGSDETSTTVPFARVTEIFASSFLAVVIVISVSSQTLGGCSTTIASFVHSSTTLNSCGGAMVVDPSGDLVWTKIYSPFGNCGVTMLPLLSALIFSKMTVPFASVTLYSEPFNVLSPSLLINVTIQPVAFVK